MKYKLTKKEYKKDLKIPKNYRLIKDWELLKLSWEDEKIKNELKEGWLWCTNIKGRTRATGVYYGVGGFLVDGDNDMGDRGRSSGVLVKKMNELPAGICPECGICFDYSYNKETGKRYCKKCESELIVKDTFGGKIK